MADLTQPPVEFAHASGVKTNCDQYVYSFSKEALGERVRHLIDAYNDAAEYLAAGFSLDECTENSDLPRIKWTETLKQSLRKNEELVFDKSRIREVLYRPFTKLWLYEDPLVLSRVKTISALFPLVDLPDPTRPDPTRPDPTRPDPTRPASASPLPTTEPFSRPWPPTPSPTSAPTEPISRPGPSLDGGDLDLGNLQHGLPSLGREDTARPGHDRGFATDQGHSQTEAILLSSPSNRTRFAALAVDLLPDLHAVDPACRAIPRRSP